MNTKIVKLLQGQPKNPVATLGLCLLGLGLTTCEKGEPHLFVHKTLSPFLAVHEDEQKTTTDVWRRGGYRLSLLNDNVAEIKSKYQKNLVMVSFESGSRLANELAQQPSTLLYIPAAEQKAGHALVHVDSPEQADALAEAAHSSNGFSCGNLENFSFALAAPAPTIYPPVYSETIKLDQVDKLISQVTRTNMQETVTTLEALPNRHAQTTEGTQATKLVEERFRKAIGTSLAGVQYSTVDHREIYASDQHSVIVTFPGQKDDLTTVILGAHLDSINKEGRTLKAPGADDNATGIATLIEVARILAASGITFERRVEFHAYAIEEQGLYGSTHIAARYLKDKRKVAAMMQIDMNGFSTKASDDTIYLVSTDTSATLRRSLKDLLNTYLGGKFVEKPLTSGSSDHRSWTNAGVPSAFPFEDPESYNSKIHTENDTSANINNYALTERFAKLALAYLAHHAGIVTSRTDYQTKLAAQTAFSKDLKLGILATGTPTLFQIAMAAPLTIKKASVCETTEAAKPACTQETILSSVKNEPSNRRIFLTSTAMALVEGTRLVVSGYNEKDELVARRTVKLEKK